MSLQDVHQINDIIMGMAVVVTLSLMRGHDFDHLAQIMRLTLGIRRQNDPQRQNDGECKAQPECRLSSHLPVSAGLGPLDLSPRGGYE
jgi:hypothetical protein